VQNHHRDAVQNLHRAIEAVGGLHSLSDLARRWGVSPARARELSLLPGFPAPVMTVGKSELFTGVEADAFRAAPRRPGPRPERATTT